VKAPKKSNQELDISQAELDRYESLDREWREYGISAPDLEELHGMGKSAVARLKVLMNAKKIKFLP